VQAIFDGNSDAFKEGERVSDRSRDRRSFLDSTFVNAINLIAIEDDERAGKEPRAAFPFAIAGIANRNTAILAFDLFPKDDMGAGFALANLGSGAFPLLVCAEGARRKTTSIGGRPQYEPVYAILASARDTGRPHNWVAGVRPWHVPRPCPRFDGGNELVGDGGVNVVSGFHAMLLH